jgi:hypothetical protein
MGLPSDTTSVENAILTAFHCTASSRRWPLLMDPQEQVCGMPWNGPIWVNADMDLVLESGL